LDLGSRCCGRSDGNITPARADCSVGNNQLSQREQLCDLTLDAANSRSVGGVVNGLLIDSSIDTVKLAINITIQLKQL
jgi:hypothetical protein